MPLRSRLSPQSVGFSPTAARIISLSEAILTASFQSVLSAEFINIIFNCLARGSLSPLRIMVLSSAELQSQPLSYLMVISDDNFSSNASFNVIILGALESIFPPHQKAYID